jgi:hypothetical protein
MCGNNQVITEHEVRNHSRRQSVRKSGTRAGAECSVLLLLYGISAREISAGKRFPFWAHLEPLSPRHIQRQPVVKLSLFFLASILRTFFYMLYSLNSSNTALISRLSLVATVSRFPSNTRTSSHISRQYLRDVFGDHCQS